jgi:hypothetical protein
MPIRFRCGVCQRLLGIARRKAGTQTRCPFCGSAITVPNPFGNHSNESEELDELVNVGTPAMSPPLVPNRPAVAPAPSQPAAPVAARPTTPATSPPKEANAEPPLFEHDLDAVLGPSLPALRPPPRPTPGPAPLPATDSARLNEEPRNLVLSPQKATALAVTVMLLIALSFVAGFLVASTK